MPPLSPSSYNSRAVRLGRQLQADLRRGRFKAGERLPAEQELAAMYGVSRSTLRRTLERLVAAGCLVKTPWHGVKVPGEAASNQGAAARQIAWVTLSMSGEAEEYARGLQDVLATSGFTLGVYCSQANPARFNQLLEHLAALHTFYGEVMGVRIARKHVGWYLATLPGAREFRAQFNRLESTDAQCANVRQFFIERHNEKQGVAA